MASAASEAAVASLRGTTRVQARHDAAIAAWLCALPCAALAAAAILAFGPPLGRLLFPAHPPYAFLPDVLEIHPEPTENARYLIALCAPLLGALATVTAPRWSARLSARTIAQGAIASQAALAAIVLASIVAQYRMRFGVTYTRGLEAPFRQHYFSPPTLGVAVLLAGAAAGALRSPRFRARAATALAGESRARGRLLTAVAVAATAIWMLPAIHSDAEIGNALASVRYHLGFTLDETFAVLNGRTPLVNFTAQYGSLWPYAIAVPMLAFGKTVLAFTIAVCTITALALLAVFGVLRQATRSAAAALLLYLPVLATSLFLIEGTPRNRSSVGSYFGAMPLRYGLPLMLAWLTARRLGRGRPGARGAWPLFAVAGIAAINNPEFGLAALGATVAALLWTGGKPTRAAVGRLAVAAATGLAAACALVTVLALARTGALPQPARLFDYARAYSVGGFAQMPIPGVLGVHLLMYLTFVAAIVVATVRALRGAHGRALTGMLAWAGVFGLGAGSYYVGRSHPDALPYLFPAWSLALALLTILAVRELAQPPLRRTALGALIALFGFGVCACSLAQTPTPWEQVGRLEARFEPTERVSDPDPLAPSRDRAVRRFVSSLADGPRRFVVKRGAPVAILLTTGHRIADSYGLVDVSAYTGVESLYTVQRIDATVATLRAAGGNTVILPDPLDASVLTVLSRDGFELLTPRGLRPYVPGRTGALAQPWPEGAVIKMVDVRHLHPRALRR
ncbi:MAG TPA: hypothetical protein VFU94_08690 [Conexibacter sp.]|nr:hypothetical protein [Conexibacter sp.]